MLIQIIIGILGTSALFLDHHGRETDDNDDYYTIFEWDDGMKMQRSLSSSITYRCGDERFILLNTLDGDREIVLPFRYAKDRTDTITGQRIAWLVLEYLKCKFIGRFDFDHLNLPWSNDLLSRIAENNAPDQADPYELIVYQTNQMNKSLFMLDQEDFLETIGNPRSFHGRL